MIRRNQFLKISSMTMLITIGFFLLSSIWTLHGTAHQDIIATTIYLHGPVLLSQTLLLSFIAWQIYSFRNIQLLVTIRGQNDFIQKKLFYLVTFEVALYFFLVDFSFVLTGHVAFRDGPLLIGLTILIIRTLLIWFLAICLITTYTKSNVVLIIVVVLLVNLGFHYIVEIKFLLLHYSNYYDPFWRALHEL